MATETPINCSKLRHSLDWTNRNDTLKVISSSSMLPRSYQSRWFSQPHNTHIPTSYKIWQYERRELEEAVMTERAGTSLHKIVVSLSGILRQSVDKFWNTVKMFSVCLEAAVFWIWTGNFFYWNRIFMSQNHWLSLLVN